MRKLDIREWDKLTPEERGSFTQQLAESMAPESWHEYHMGKGVCSNQDGAIIQETLLYAKRALVFLLR